MTLMAVLAAAGLLGAAQGSGVSWAFPGAGADNSPLPANTRVSVAGSAVHYSAGALDDMANAPDWFAQRHPGAPTIVLHGSAKVAACGYCHLPDGSGRIENADLRGLPVSYIEAQVHAFASGSRRSADPTFAPTRYMAQLARAVRPADLRAAARYFAALDPVSRTSVIEAAEIPRAVPWHYFYRFAPSQREPLGLRIIEGPDDPMAYDLHDPRVRATAWVPRGAIARGRAIATQGIGQGAGAIPACTGCHGADLVGIAGASPTYIARQLAGFRSRARNDPDAAPMQAVAAKLTDGQIVDLAAFVGSHRPWTQAQMRAALAHER